MILQNLIGTTLNLVDTFMVGKLGKEALAAVGLANQLYFLMVLIIFGINSGASVFMSQFWGKGDEHSIIRTLGTALSTGVIVSLAFTIPGVFFPKWLLGLFIENSDVVSLGAGYLKIVALSYVINSISLSYSIASRSIAKAKLPMLVNLIALIINIVFNYLLIFGKFGFSMMGVKGAALATLIARSVETIVIVAVLKKSGGPLSAPIKDLLDFSKSFYKRIMKTAMPVIINEALWALGTIMYTKAIAHMGATEFAAYQLAYSIFRFFEITFIGIGGSAQVFIGAGIGAKDYDGVKEKASFFFKTNLAFTIIINTLMFLSAEYLVSLYSLPQDVSSSAQALIKLLAVFSFFKNINLLLIVGILRGGGDTKYAATLEITVVWLIGVPLAFIGAYYLSTSVVFVTGMIMSEEVIKAIIGFIRYRSGKWINNLVEEA